jgi:DNA polymerase sigma
MWHFYEDNAQTPDLLTRKNRLRDALHKILTTNFPKYETELFIVGSSATGLANNKSDVDICLVMKDMADKVEDKVNGEAKSAKESETAQEAGVKNEDKRQSLTSTRDDLLDSIVVDVETTRPEVVSASETKTDSELIHYESDSEKLNVTVDSTDSTAARNDPTVPMLKMVEEVLKNYNFVTNMQIIMAKVPILKFVDRLSGIEVTLNVNKLVSIRNTLLIQDYTRADWRLQPLALVIKSWAKDNGINDAYNKSLSSYSLVLMVVHYLQYACSPPVLPCLQQLDPNRYTVKESMHALRTNRKPKPWHSVNDASLKDLLLGFLDYYSYSFCFAKDALSVRTAHVLPKHVVQRYKCADNHYSHWKFVCVEEPFTRTNTARSVYDEVTFERILSVFRVSHYTVRRYPKLDSIMTGRDYTNDYMLAINQYVNAGPTTTPTKSLGAGGGEGHESPGADGKMVKASTPTGDRDKPDPKAQALPTTPDRQRSEASPAKTTTPGATKTD